MKNWTKKIENVFAAITFAEAGCYETAREFLKVRTKFNDGRSLNGFLDSVGLRGVRYSYIVARV